MYCAKIFWVSFLLLNLGLGADLDKPSERLLVTSIGQQSLLGKMSGDLLVIVCEHSTPSEMLKVAKSCKKMKSAVEKIFDKIYVNVAPNTGPIALFKHLAAKKFILEDPEDMLNPKWNQLSKHFLTAQAKQSLNFESADWELIFQFATMQHKLSVQARLMFVPEGSRNFLDRLAETAAENISSTNIITGEHFHIAVKLGNPNVVRIILEGDAAGKWVNTPDRIGWLPLFHTIYTPNQAVAKVLIDYGADPYKTANINHARKNSMRFCKQAISVNSGYAKNFIPLKAIEKMMVESRKNLKRKRKYE